MKLLSVCLFLCMISKLYGQENEMMQGSTRLYYVVSYKQGPNWEKGKPMAQQNLNAHRQYYQKLLEEEKVVIGGAFLEAVEGMSILSVANKAEAEFIIKNDPAITMGIFVTEVKTLYAVFKGLSEEKLDLKNPSQKKVRNKKRCS